MKGSQASTWSVWIVILSGILLIGLVFYGTYLWQHAKVVDLQNQVSQLNSKVTNTQKQSTEVSAKDETTYVSDKGVAIKIYSPLKAAKVSSPLALIGEVPGNWSFEGTFLLY